MDNYVLLDIDARGVATLTLNRPKLHNAFDDVMIRQLLDHLKSLHTKKVVRVLVLKGEGASFCAGADLHWMKRSVDFTEAENQEDARSLSLLMQTLDNMPMPTVAYVHGAVFGGGVGLVACCDMAFGDFETRFSLSEVRLGLVPAVIGPYVMRAIGERQVRRFFLSGERFDAIKAKSIGLLHDVVNRADADSFLDHYVEEMLSCGPKAVKRAKKMIQDLSGGMSEQNRRMTIELIADVRMSEEAQTGLNAFFKKESPPWVLRKGGRNV